MAQTRHNLLFHPVRYRIIRALNGANLSTQGITDTLGDVPQSTIYRHLRLLLKSDIIALVDSREINGITEKIYGVRGQHNLSAEEFAALNKEEQIANIELFAMALMQSMSKALEDTPQATFSAMSLAYREYTFYATEDEFLEIRRAIFKILRDAEKKYSAPKNNQRKYKVNITTHEEPN